MLNGAIHVRALYQELRVIFSCFPCVKHLLTERCAFSKKEVLSLSKKILHAQICTPLSNSIKKNGGTWTCCCIFLCRKWSVIYHKWAERLYLNDLIATVVLFLELCVETQAIWITQALSPGHRNIIVCQCSTVIISAIIFIPLGYGTSYQAVKHVVLVFSHAVDSLTTVLVSWLQNVWQVMLGPLLIFFFSFYYFYPLRFV